MPKRSFISVLETVCRWGAILGLAVLTVAPVVDLFLARAFWSGLPEAGALTEHALITLAFFAAALASLLGKHLSLGQAPDGKTSLMAFMGGAEALAVAAIDALLFASSLSLLLVGFEPSDRIFGLPIALFASPMAIGFLLMTMLDVMRAGTAGTRIASVLGIVFGLFLASGALLNIASAFGLYPAILDTLSGWAPAFASVAIWPLAAMLVFLAFMGLPLYAVLSGVAGLLFIAASSSVELIPSEAYSLLMNDSMPAIPLFTVAGFVLSESGAGKRLVGVFREWFGWMPGGEAFAAVLVCAFFTTFTGANGVAILALGGILATVLKDSGSYDEGFAHGFVTASSSVGLLFPPSMAVIVYAVNATFVVQGESAFSIGDMFLGGLLPGALLVLAMGGMGVARSLANKAPRRRFDVKGASAALWKALPEIVIPLIILVLYLTGFAGLTEIGAIVLLYVAIVEGPIRKDLDAKSLAASVTKALPVAGGALIIIAAARGLSFYTMEAGVPELFAGWLTSVVHSRLVFLLLLNLALLLVGCFMDIFSAVLVISPLVIPLGAAYGVNPVHLGVIFIANLSIGFLTPPIGMNLFLASYAFNKPVGKIFKDVLPFFVLQLVVLAVITWVPWLSLALIGQG